MIGQFWKGVVTVSGRGQTDLDARGMSIMLAGLTNVAVVVSDYVVESNCTISDVRCSKTERDKVVCRISVSWMPKETFKLYKISGFLSWVESLRKTHLLFASDAGVSVREDGEGRDPWTGREASQGNPSKASNKQRLVRRCVMELYWNVFPKNDWELNANGWLA